MDIDRLNRVQTTKIKSFQHPWQQPRNFTIVAAVDNNMGLGYKGELLAHIPDDLKRFKKLTVGSTVVMGRKTYESLPNGALPSRTNIVLSRRKVKYDGAIVMTLKEFLSAYKHQQDVFVIGGAQIYEQLLPYTKDMYLTHIYETFKADTWFPMSIAFNKDSFVTKATYAFAHYTYGGLK